MLKSAEKFGGSLFAIHQSALECKRLFIRSLNLQMCHSVTLKENKVNKHHISLHLQSPYNIFLQYAMTNKLKYWYTYNTQYDHINKC